MQAVLGKDNPYKDIGALRRALRSDKDSFAYKKSHYAVRDYRQYERWKGILGEENMPKTLAEFQDLKYNNNDKFEELREVKEYRVRLEKRIIKTKHEHDDKLTTKEGPNSIHDLEENGKVLQRRVYDNEGNPSVDIDTTDHNMPKHHPKGGHKHYWNNGVRDTKPTELDDLDRIKNKDILEDKDD